MILSLYGKRFKINQPELKMKGCVFMLNALNVMFHTWLLIAIVSLIFSTYLVQSVKSVGMLQQDCLRDDLLKKRNNRLIAMRYIDRMSIDQISQALHITNNEVRRELDVLKASDKKARMLSSLEHAILGNDPHHQSNKQRGAHY